MIQKILSKASLKKNATILSKKKKMYAVKTMIPMKTLQTSGTMMAVVQQSLAKREIIGKRLPGRKEERVGR